MIGHRAPAHSWNHDISHQEVDHAGVFLAEPQGLKTVLGLQQVITVCLQDPTSKCPDHLFILNQQHGFRAEWNLGRGMDKFGRLHFIGNPRQIHRKGRAAPWLAVYGDVPRALLDDPIHGG